jgi:hypothetical protein
MSSNNFEMKFVGNNELLVPVSSDVIELNRFFLDSSAKNTDTNSLDKVPYFGGPVSYTESNNPMPVLGVNSLTKPINVFIPDKVAPDGPFILLSKALQDGSRCTGTEPPETNITPDFLLNTQNVIPLSAEYGLPKVPMLQDPYNKLNNTGIVNASHPLTKLDNTNFTPDMTTNSQFSMMNRQPPPMNPDQALAMMYASQDARETPSEPNYSSSMHVSPAMQVINSSPSLRLSPAMQVIHSSPSMRPSPSMHVSPSMQVMHASPSMHSMLANPALRTIHASPSRVSTSPARVITSPARVNKIINPVKNTKMTNKSLMKKVIMYLSIAILIYIIYLVISRRR